MRHLLIIGARNTGTSIYLVSLALKKGFSVTVLTATHDDLSDTFEPEVNVFSIEITARNVIQWLNNSPMAQAGKLMITTTHDLYASVTAQVASHFNVPGPNCESVTRWVSKFQQEELLSELGYRSGTTVRVQLSGITTPIPDVCLEYPVVIKPVEGSASYGIKKCQSIREVRSHLDYLSDIYNMLPARIPGGEVLIEKFIDGEEYCVEIFDGLFVGMMKKIKRPGDTFIERGYSTDTALTDEQTDKVIGIVEHIAQAMRLTWGPVHIDCLINDWHIHVIEVNPRIAGSFITAIIRDAWEFDMADALLRRLCNEMVKIERRRQPVKLAQVFFILDNDPPGWYIPSVGRIDAGPAHLEYAPQLIPARERRAYTYLVVG